ncbi:LOW QUALITY PROTEIN: hypothetical protein V2J09_011244 [Rumex salicifolius]
MYTLKELIRTHNPAILVLVETRLSGPQADKVCKNIGYDGMVRVEAVGFKGGIWKTAIIQLQQIDVHHQVVTMEVCRSGDMKWIFSAIYADPIPTNREELWERLLSFNDSNSRPWLLMGDFNETMSLDERTRDSDGMRRRCEKFHGWVDDMELLDLVFSVYLDKRKRDYHKNLCRLDRSLCNIEWREELPKASIKHLARNQLDHAPLLMKSSGFITFNPQNRPFRFQAAWMMHEEFQSFVADNWKPGAQLPSALKMLAENLNALNRGVFGNLFRRRDRLWRRIEGAQHKMCEQPSYSLMKLESELRQELDVILELIHLFWVQKARIDVLRDGDRNTKFFHAYAVVRRKRNKIEGLHDANGNWVDNHSGLQAWWLPTLQTYLPRNQIPMGLLTFLGEDSSLYPQRAYDDLDRDYSVEDIKANVDDMGPLQAPAPDGFHVVFFQKNWDIVQREVGEMVMHVLRGGDMPENFNEILLFPLGKVDFPENVNQLRPISLCNVAF